MILFMLFFQLIQIGLILLVIYTVGYLLLSFSKDILKKIFFDTSDVKKEQSEENNGTIEIIEIKEEEN